MTGIFHKQGVTLNYTFDFLVATVMDECWSKSYGNPRNCRSNLAPELNSPRPQTTFTRTQHKKMPQQRQGMIPQKNIDTTSQPIGSLPADILTCGSSKEVVYQHL